MAIHWKVSGVMTPTCAASAAEAGAWAISMVFDRHDPRFVNADTAREITAALPDGVLTVGLFRNQSKQVIETVIERLGLDLIELAGHETDEQVAELEPRRVIKHVVLHELTRADMVAQYSAGWLQVNRAAEGVEGGGVGVDPALARALITERPETILAGEPGIHGLAELLDVVRPAALDTGSTLESKRGELDPIKIQQVAAILADYNQRLAAGN